ncbi:MAG: divalent-cation tolerance protein CutA [Candidatus Latescibacteria bacterium]|nr:divalent-cation tolerance protein CutA [Candidatus Latescibacterota bacterium]
MVVPTTAPDLKSAQKIGRDLVERAACVNVVPGVRSIYRWDGEVQNEEEVVLIIKSSPKALDRLTQAIKELHPYDVPEVAAIPVVGGSKEYLEWVVAPSL